MEVWTPTLCTYYVCIVRRGSCSDYPLTRHASRFMHATYHDSIDIAKLL